MTRTAYADDVATGAAQAAYCRVPATGVGPIGSGCVSRTKAGGDRLAGKGRRRTTRTKPAARQDPRSSGRQDDGAQSSTSCGEADGTDQGRQAQDENRKRNQQPADQAPAVLLEDDRRAHVHRVRRTNAHTCESTRERDVAEATMF